MPIQPTKLLMVPTLEIRNMVTEAVDLSLSRGMVPNLRKPSPKHPLSTFCYGVFAYVGMAFKKESPKDWLF